MGENFGEFGESVGNRQNFPKNFSCPKIRFIILWHACEVGTLFEMAGILQYFKLKRQKESLPSPLPDPNGPLSQKIPSSGIVSANACVGKLPVLDSGSNEGSSTSRGPYAVLTPAQKYEIGKRAA